MLFAEAHIHAVPTEEGGRRTPICARGGSYRPHIRVRGEGEWLGVCFIDGPEAIAPGGSGQVTLHLAYHPRVDYSAVEPGEAIEVVEGACVVARGTTLRVWGAEMK